MSTVNSVTADDLVAIDIETTGLTPEGNIILEIGVYTPKISGAPWRVAIAPEGGVPPKMDGVVVAMHTKSGLLAECFGDLAALGRVLGELDNKGGRGLDERYPLTVPVDWVWFADRLGERRPFGEEIKTELRDAWGEHYGFKILNQALLPAKNSRRVFAHLEKLLPVAVDDLTTPASRSRSEGRHV